MTDVLPPGIDADERAIAKAALEAAEEQLQSLCASYAGTFVSVERRSQSLVSALKNLQSRIKQAEEQVDGSRSALEQEEDDDGGSLATLSERHRVRRRTLLQHSSLLELLELPSLMDACVRSSLYEEALSIAAFANTLERRHTEKNEVVVKVIDQVRSRQSDLRRHLLNSLKSYVTMPQCLEIVTAMRRLNSVDLERRNDASLDRIHAAMELSLQVDFLESRDAWLDTQASVNNNSSSSSLLTNEVSLRSSEHLLDTIERYRTRVFEIATQFNAIFRAQSNVDQASTSIISMWITRTIHSFLALLSFQLNRMEDSASLRDAMDASVFFAVSMGRLGADFSAQLSPLFENKMLDLAHHSWHDGTQQLTETLKLCREAGVATPLTSTSHNEPTDVNINSVEDLPVDGPLAPPRKLMSFPPLARLVNSFLLGLNELRRCLLPGIFLRLRKSLEDELAAVTTVLVMNERAVMTPGLRGDAAELRQYATEMKKVLEKVVKPYVRGAMESSLGNHAAATAHYGALEEPKEEIEPIQEAEEEASEEPNEGNDDVKDGVEGGKIEVKESAEVVSSSSLPRPVVFCGPSGVGKGTLIELLMKKFPSDQFGFSVSHTTRGPREGEVDGKHYHFTSVDEIKKEIDADKFIEYANVHGNYYGTSVASVESVQKAGQICILDIDVQGVQNVKKNAASLESRYIFIAPPSMESLEKRLRGRGTETEEAIQRRLGNASKELEYGNEPGNFDKVFINNDLQETFADMARTFQEWYPHLKEE